MKNKIRIMFKVRERRGSGGGEGRVTAPPLPQRNIPVPSYSATQASIFEGSTTPQKAGLAL
jgi:hypothetical protein